MTVPRLKIGFIGGGQMATAISMGIIKSNMLAANSHVIISDPDKLQLAKLQQKFEQFIPQDIQQNINFELTTDNKHCINNCDIIILAVKPQIIPYVFQELKHAWDANSLIISIMGGVTLDTLSNQIRTKQRIIRVMPNMPALVNKMAAGIVKGEYATDQDLELSKQLLTPLGFVKVISKEHLLDVLTGLSGSGPAFVFMLIESMADAGVKCGLSRKDSLQFAAQTVYGAASLCLETGTHCAELKDTIASPAGTTIAGIFELEKLGFRYSVMKAVEAAVNRSRELGQRKSKL